MSKRRRKGEPDTGSGGWLTTFSDLMSLLLTFFILLFSMSTVDTSKFTSVTSSIQSVLGGRSGETSIFEGESGQMPILSGGQQEILDQVNEFVSEQGLEETLTVTADERGIYVDVNEAILFESGSADIKASGVRVLQQLQGLLEDYDNDIVVEGHTDNVPTSRTYPTNWELSTARAVSVARYLIEIEGINPTRVSATGFSEYRPIAPNDSAENRAKNRRVNILIVFDEESEA